MERHGPDRHLTDGSERATYPDGSTDETTENVDVLADVLSVDGYVRTCRECGDQFVTQIPSNGTKWTDTCGFCLAIDC